MSLFANENCFAGRIRRGVPVLLMLGLMVSGCVGKRPDFLNAMLQPRGTKDLEEIEDSTKLSSDKKAIDKDDRSLIASKDNLRPQDEFGGKFPTFAHRARKSTETADPFIGATEKKHVAKPRKPTETKSAPSIDELLASFDKKQPAGKATGQAADAWWKEGGSKTASLAKKPAEYAQEFDSRLDRLRAELAGVSKPTQAADKINPFTESDSEINPFADDHPLDANMASASKPNAMLDSSEQPTLGNTKSRIKAMLADSRNDRENWNLRRAYRTALDAQELAVLESVSFSSDEERPSELAEKIATDLRQDNVKSASLVKAVGTKDAVDTKSLFASVRTQSAGSSKIGFPEFGKNDTMWSSISAGKEDLFSEPTAENTVDPFSSSQGSGVNLLPPDDDFPSEAAEIDWGSDSSLGAVSPFASSPSSIDFGTTADSPDEIQLTKHDTLFPTFSRHDEPQQQLTGLSEADNRELLSTVADQRSRVLETNSVEWPSLSSPDRLDMSDATSSGPIRVAEAPRFALDADATLAVAETEDASSAAPQTSLLGQVWRLQPAWLVGGLLLLMIALRLLPWRRHESA